MIDLIDDLRLMGRGEAIKFVKNVNGGLMDLEVGQDLIDGVKLVEPGGRRDINDVEDKLGFEGFHESGFKSFDEFGGQVVDKADGVGDKNGEALVWNLEAADDGVESGEETGVSVFLFTG